jgi:hypothetical protein
MSDIAETVEYRDHLIEIHYDPEPMSPRDWDNGTHMVCFHTRYDLGDKHDLRSEDHAGWAELVAAIRETYDVVGPILPLWLYDHGGITMRVGGADDNGNPFMDAGGWDSGIVGFIFMDRAGQEMCGTPDDHIETCLKGDVETYDRYLTGQVYGHVIKGPKLTRTVLDDSGHVLRTFTEREEVDACWSYYGEVSELIAECKGIVDAELGGK